MDIEMEEYRRQFYQEAREILDQVNEDILQAESEPDNAELINSIFRGIHTIKGSAGGFELDELSEFAHHLEGILNQARDGQIAFSSELVDLVLQGMDRIAEIIAAYEQGQTPEVDQSLVREFIAFARSQTTQRETGLHSGADPEHSSEVYERTSQDVPGDGGGQDWKFLVGEENVERIAADLDRGAGLYQVRVKYSSDEMLNGFDPLIFLQNLHEESIWYQAVSTWSELPGPGDFDPFVLYLRPTVLVQAFMSAADLADLAFDPGLVEVQVLARGEKQELRKEEIAEDMLAEFLVEARGHVQNMEARILDYEKNDDRDALQEMFRAVHTLKGDAGYLHLQVLSSFCHALESVLDQLRHDKRKKSGHVIDLILRSIDFIKDVLDDLEGGQREFALPVFYAQLEQLAAEAASDQGAEEHLEYDERMEVFVEQALEYQALFADYLENPQQSWNSMLVRCLKTLVRSADYLGLTELSTRAGNVLLALEQGQDIRNGLKDVLDFIQAMAKGPKRLGEILCDDGKIAQRDLEDALNRQKPLGTILVEQGKVKPSDIDQALQKQQLMEAAARKAVKPVRKEGPRGEEPRVIRVDEHKIDHFSNLIGELIVAKNSYDYLLQRMARIAPDVSLDFIKSLKENLYLFARIVNSLQEGVLSIRMVPVKGIFQKFNRVVRDISRKQSKSIQLILDGEETEVDKKVADMLSDPLIHLVRNACDHGLESREERKKQGKSEQGVVILRAYREGRDIVIKVIDDGRGIDPQKLYAKALERGLSPPDPSDPNILNLIFEPAFSTAEKITDVSGRGVGMDVVKSSVETLGGKVQVHSELGEGAEVTLSIPMSIGINTVLMLEERGQYYGLPIENVAETFKIVPRSLRRLNGSYGLAVREDVLPVETLQGVLSGRGSTAIADWYRQKQELEDLELPVVVLQTKKGRFGLIVEKLNKNIELAVKPVPEQLAHLRFLGGVSIMGDGRVALVLNPENLV